MTKCGAEEERLCLAHTSTSKQSPWEVGAETEAEVMEDRHLLACSSWLAQPASLFLPGVAPPPAARALSHQSVIEKALCRFAYGRFAGDIFSISIEGFLSDVKVTED